MATRSQANMHAQIASLQKQAINQVSKVLEKQVDAEIDRLSNLTEDDLGKMRQKRIREMKERADKREKWRRTGHGTVDEIVDQKDFYTFAKNSERVVVLFYREGSKWCDIITSILVKIAYKHYETRFLKMNAERAAIIVSQLDIRMMPTMILCKNKKVDRKLQGLDAFSSDGNLNVVNVERVLHDMGFLEEVLFDDKNQLDSLRDAFQTTLPSDDDSDSLDL